MVGSPLLSLQKSVRLGHSRQDASTHAGSASDRSSVFTGASSTRVELAVVTCWC